MAMKLRTDDEVIVISGKDKGKTGKILRVDRRRERVYVEGINIVKRHQRPNPARPNSFFVRTTTALTTSPFLTDPCGLACLTVAVMMSPTPA